MSVCNTCALEKECMLKYDVSARMFCNSYAEKKHLTNIEREKELSRIRQEAYEQGYQDGKVDGYNLAGTRMSSVKQEVDE